MRGVHPGGTIHPYDVYPGFTDPDDWRMVSADFPVKDYQRQVCHLMVDDATAKHLAGKHVHHDHPWCEDCQIRFDRIENADIGVSDSSSDDDQRKHIRPLLLRRAARWSALKGKPPVDTFEPDALANKFDAEYLDADELDSLPKPEPLIEGVLMAGSYSALRGRDGVWKSFVALDWSLCIATGKSWQGRPVERRHVLYVAGEGVYGIASRVKAWEAGWGRKVDPEWFTVRRSAVNLYKAGADFGDLLRRVEDYQSGLVVIDTLRRASGGADGNGSDMGIVIDNVARIIQAAGDGSVLMVTHTDKGDNDTRGYSGIEDDADTIWSAKRSETDVLTLKNEKMKDGPDGLEFTLKPIPCIDSLVLGIHNAHSVSANDLGEAESAVLESMRNDFALTGATANELIETTGLAKTSFYRARGNLLKSGLLVLTGTASRQRIELSDSQASPNLSSQPVPRTEPPENLEIPTSSNLSQADSQASPTSSTPLIGGTGTGTDAELEQQPREAPHE